MMELESGYAFTKAQIAELESLRVQVQSLTAERDRFKSALEEIAEFGFCDTAALEDFCKETLKGIS